MGKKTFKDFLELARIYLNEMGRGDLSSNSLELISHAELLHFRFNYDNKKDLEKLMPKKSYVWCAICGRTFKSLPRHLNESHGINEQDYKFRFNIPGDVVLTATKLRDARAAEAKRRQGKFEKKDDDDRVNPFA